MCVVSMVSQHYMDKWPPNQFNTISITIAQWEEYKELKRKAIEYDKMTKQPDCQDSQKIEWEKAMEDYLKKKGIIT